MQAAVFQRSGGKSGQITGKYGHPTGRFTGIVVRATGRMA
jgi:hypothetical protein